MEVVRQRRRKQWAAAILNTGIHPLDKVRKLVALGYDEAEAEQMVNGMQIGNQPLYYEQLPNADYAQDGQDGENER
jgi:Holliday junction resolvasome RuvABC DNA-binding subunit